MIGERYARGFVAFEGGCQQSGPARSVQHQDGSLAYEYRGEGDGVDAGRVERVGKGACASLDYAGIGPYAAGWNQLQEEGYDEAYVKEQQAKDMALILVSVPTLCPENQSVVDAVFQLAEGSN